MPWAHGWDAGIKNCSYIWYLYLTNLLSEDTGAKSCLLNYTGYILSSKLCTPLCLLQPLVIALLTFASLSFSKVFWRPWKHSHLLLETWVVLQGLDAEERLPVSSWESLICIFMFNILSCIRKVAPAHHVSFSHSLASLLLLKVNTYYACSSFPMEISNWTHPKDQAHWK